MLTHEISSDDDADYNALGDLTVVGGRSTMTQLPDLTIDSSGPGHSSWLSAKAPTVRLHGAALETKAVPLK